MCSHREIATPVDSATTSDHAQYGRRVLKRALGADTIKVNVIKYGAAELPYHRAIGHMLSSRSQ